jgi:hypothetical protein
MTNEVITLVKDTALASVGGGGGGHVDCEKAGIQLLFHRALHRRDDQLLILNGIAEQACKWLSASSYY